jgi:hypothetical protein
VLALGEPTMAEITAAGATRVSVGGGLTWAAVEAMAEAAVRMRDDGDFSLVRGGGRTAGWLAG